MHILFENSVQIPIELTNSPIQSDILNIYKHLQHVEILFREWDSPYYLLNITYAELVDRLILFGKNISIEVNRQLCLDRSQAYFNFLHEIYEKNYNGVPAWLQFHEHIHLCEIRAVKNTEAVLLLNYREKAGLLEKKFKIEWLNMGTTKINAGDVYLQWAELGKIPYHYWENNEPNDITRLCELAKPWLKLKPKLTVALEDIDRLKTKDIDNFNSWWETYHTAWCQHWNITQWTIEDMYKGIVVGKINPIDQVIDLLKHQIYPVKVQL